MSAVWPFASAGCKAETIVAAAMRSETGRTAATWPVGSSAAARVAGSSSGGTSRDAEPAQPSATGEGRPTPACGKVLGQRVGRTLALGAGQHEAVRQQVGEAGRGDPRDGEQHDPDGEGTHLRRRRTRRVSDSMTHDVRPASLRGGSGGDAAHGRDQT